MLAQLSARGAFSPTRGTIRVRARLTRDFVVISNRMAQNCDLTLAARGLGAFMLSLDDGTDVSIHTLGKVLKESQAKIGAALHELESAGYLSRTRIQLEDGKWVTRTVIRNLPGLEDPGLPPVPEFEAELPPVPEFEDLTWPDAPPITEFEGSPECAEFPHEVFSEEIPAHAASPAIDLTDPPEEAIRVVLDAARAEPRLRVGRKHLPELARLVADALAAGESPATLRRALTWDIPDNLRAPFGLMRHRLHDRMRIVQESVPMPTAPRTVHVCEVCERPSPDRQPFSGGRCGPCRE